jgi:hypothetical protein
MKWFIITALLVVLFVAAGVWFALAPASAPTTKLVEIGPTPLDDQIRYAIDHSK